MSVPVSLTKKAEMKKRSDIVELASLLHDFWRGCSDACPPYHRLAQKVYAMLDETECRK